MTPLPVSVRTDSLAEGSEFEPAVPVYELSDDSIMLEFATARRIALIAYESPRNRPRPRCLPFHKS